ncbi:MAG: hypothetical protein WB807_04920 [Candidatus Dormiibacterota bacterium]
MPSLVDAAPREVHVTIPYSIHDVDSIARQAGFAVSHDEATAILDHIDRETATVARSAAAAAIDARIAELVEVVRSAHLAPSRSASDGSTWPRRLSMC